MKVEGRGIEGIKEVALKVLEMNDNVKASCIEEIAAYGLASSVSLLIQFAHKEETRYVIYTFDTAVAYVIADTILYKAARESVLFPIYREETKNRIKDRMLETIDKMLRNIADSGKLAELILEEMKSTLKRCNVSIEE